jgi:anti-anti-sigma factor
MVSKLDISLSEKKGNVPVTVLHLAGELDAKTQKSLELRADEVMAGGAKNLVLDLSGVTYLGSAGVRAMHAIACKLEVGEAEGGLYGEFIKQSEEIAKKLKAGESEIWGIPAHLKLFKPSPDASKVLKALGFDRYFQIYDDLDGAVMSF